MFWGVYLFVREAFPRVSAIWLSCVTAWCPTTPLVLAVFISRKVVFRIFIFERSVMTLPSTTGLQVLRDRPWQCTRTTYCVWRVGTAWCWNLPQWIYRDFIRSSVFIRESDRGRGAPVPAGETKLSLRAAMAFCDLSDFPAHEQLATQNLLRPNQARLVNFTSGLLNHIAQPWLLRPRRFVCSEEVHTTQAVYLYPRLPQLRVALEEDTMFWLLVDYGNWIISWLAVTLGDLNSIHLGGVQGLVRVEPSDRTSWWLFEEKE